MLLIDSSRQPINFIADTRFFLTSFHTGTVNILLHILSVTAFIIGLFSQNLLLSILGLAVIDELGHIFNYFVLHKFEPQYNPIRMVPYQLIYIMPPALLLLKIFQLI